MPKEKMYHHEMKIIKDFNMESVQKKYKKYMDSIEDKYSTDFNVSHWIKLVGREIWLFLFVENYSDDDDLEKLKELMEN
jgi:hypothetical protein